jgi:hypothetical protein
MNIGKWIIVAFILFAAFMATLVTICLRQDVSLVSKNYYQEELKYQEQIHRLNNAENLREKPAIKMSADKVTVVFPGVDQPVTGRLTLFCPSDETMDRNFNISSKATQVFDLIGAKKGMYHIRLTWRTQEKEYYQDEIVYI